jgi:hypothetical protein
MRKLLTLWIALAALCYFQQDTRAQGWLPLARSGGAAYTGPGNVVAFTWWGGFRAYSAATAGTKAVRLVRASDSTQQDINTLANGTFDAASATTFCNATTCKVVTVYDKVGTNDVTQATDANRPALTANAINTSYCMTFTAVSNTFLASAGTYTASQPYSAVVMFKGVGANGDTGAFAIMNAAFTNGFTVGVKSGEVLWRTYAGTALDVTYTNNVWHALKSVINGASSIGIVDATETTGDAGAQAITAQNINWGTNQGAQPAGGLSCEAGYKAATMTSGERTSLNTNMHGAYGSW